MGGGSVGCRAALASRRLTPEPISSSPGTARSPPSISSMTSCRDLDAAATTSITPPQPAASPRNGVISRHFLRESALLQKLTRHCIAAMTRWARSDILHRRKAGSRFDHRSNLTVPPAPLGRVRPRLRAKTAHRLRSFDQTEPKRHLAGSWRRALQLVLVPWSKR
jgi:hypothetical protein